MISTHLKFLLVLGFVGMAYKANAIEISGVIGKNLNHYCLTFSNQNYSYPSQEELISNVIQGLSGQAHGGTSPTHLRDVFWRTLVDQRIYTGLETAGILLNYCGPEAVTVTLSPYQANLLSSWFSSRGIALTRVQDGLSRAEYTLSNDELRAIIAEGNQFIDYLITTIRSHLDGNIDLDLELLKREVRLQVQEWLNSYRPNPYLLATGDGPREILNSVILWNLGGADNSFLWEVSSIISPFESLLQLRRNHPSYLEARAARSQRNLSDLIGVSGLQTLAQALPHLSNVINSQIIEAENRMLMTNAENALNQRLRAIDEVIFPWLNSLGRSRMSGFGDAGRYSQSTINLLAEGFVESLSYLETAEDSLGNRLFGAEEIADSLNRQIVLRFGLLPRFIDGVFETRILSPQENALIEKLLTYPNLNPFVFTLLKAIQAEGNEAGSSPPSEEVIRSFSMLQSRVIMDRNTPDKPFPIPKMVFGNLFNQAPGTTTVEIVAELNFIMKWFEKHGVNHVHWTQWNGTSLEIFQSRVVEERRAYLERRQVSSALGETRPPNPESCASLWKRP